MDRGKILLSAGVGLYFIALIFFWVSTSGINNGWYTHTTDSINYDYGTLNYQITVAGVTYTCSYEVPDFNSSDVNATFCVDRSSLKSSGQFVIVDTIFTWLCLMPTLAILIAFTYFKPSLGLAKVAWGLGALTFFWSIWAWLVFGIKFGGTGASPSWAWALNFVAFILTAAGLALSIAGVRCGSESYEVMGGGDAAGAHELIE